MKLSVNALTRAALTGAVTLVATAAHAAPPVPQCKAATDMPAKSVVATIGAETITVAALDARLSDALCAARIEHSKKMHELRSAGLKNMLDERLIEAEATRQKLKDGQALMNDHFKTVAAPNDEVVKAFFAENQARFEGRPFEQIGPQIKDFLHQQAKEAAYDKFVTALRATAKVKETLAPFRMPVAATGPAKGPATAPITIVEFADFECGYCARAGEVVTAVMAKYPGKVRLVFRDFPLGFHSNAVPAAIAARCANAQGKYWQMHDGLFAAGALGDDTYRTLATELKLDEKKFAACMADPAQAAAVQADQKAGARAGVSGTPAFFINGIPLSGARPISDFAAIIDAELARTK